MLNEVEELEAIVAAVYIHLGFAQPTGDDGSWDLDAAAGRLARQGIPQNLPTIVRALFRVHRAVHAAWLSSREDVIATNARANDELLELAAFLREVREKRQSEAEFEEDMRIILGERDPHGASRNALVDAELEACARDAEALKDRLGRLANVLASERPAEVEAGLYSANGAGPPAHFATSLMDDGMHERAVALLRGDVRITDPTMRSPVQKAELRAKGERVRAEVNRARSAIRSKGMKKMPYAG